MDAAFTEGRSAMDWIRWSYNAAGIAQAKTKNIPMPEFDAFWAAGQFVEFSIPDAARSHCRSLRRLPR